jgi:hypothetical protein
MTQDYENGKGGISAYVDAGADVEFAFLVEPFDQDAHNLYIGANLKR